jgi:hypothetical protein
MQLTADRRWGAMADGSDLLPNTLPLKESHTSVMNVYLSRHRPCPLGACCPTPRRAAQLVTLNNKLVARMGAVIRPGPDSKASRH